MSAPNPPMRPSEILARGTIDQLLEWAGAVLGFAPEAMRPVPSELVAAGGRAQGVASLPAAHEQLLLRAGGRGPGSALDTIFGADLVGVDAMVGAAGSAPMRQVGLELIEALGYGLDEFDVVIRVRRGDEVDYVVTGSPDPPVWSFVAGGDEPVLRHPSFTDWLQSRVVRAAKRRHPLRRVSLPASPATT